MPQTSFDSPHFTLHELASGVYAAISKREEGGEFVNAGFVDLGDATLVFDTLWLPQSARDLLRAAQEITGRPPDWLVNSHYHADHTNGNALFPPETIIVSTEGTRALLDDWEEEIAETRADLPEMVKNTQAQHEAATDDKQKVALARQVRMRTWLAEGYEAVQARRPAVTFPDQLTFHGSARTVEVLTYGGGHTKSDSFLYLRDEGIVFAGDLVVVETHPYMGDAVLDYWPLILRRMKELEISQIVPGHGPVGDREDIDAMLTYFEALDVAVEGAIAEGTEAGEVAVPAPYADWFGGAFPINIGVLMARNRGVESEQ